MESKLLVVSHLDKAYIEGNHKKQILGDISFSMSKKETLGITGKSGIGKSTLARILVGLENADGGAVYFEGKDLLTMSPSEMKTIRPGLQLVFQNYRKALNPYMKISGILKEVAQGQDCLDLLEQVGLDSSLLHKYPNQLSGGQAQRLNIIRALAIKPKLLILDEATSGLDARTVEELMGTLKKAQKTMEFGLIIISHDLNVIEKECTRLFEM
jgi:ABC-type dipeptide/oligopeptide/nickel transport system ATPase subunit